MKTLGKQVAGLFLVMLFVCNVHPLYAQSTGEDNESFITVSGTVRDQSNRKKLEYVNVSVPGTNIGTITNSEGIFTIKIRRSLGANQIQFSHIGYLNSIMPVNGRDLSDITVQMYPSAIALEEVVVRARDPRYIVEEAMKKIPSNYSRNSNMLTGFYRETAQKGRRYINISEAIIDIYKSPYSDMNSLKDRVQIYKGRKLLSQRMSDTLVVKLLGGPNLSVFVDVVKNPDILLDEEMLSNYMFKMEESVMLDNRPHYVIRFTPQMIVHYALYEGKLYIDKEKLSFTRAEFNLDMSDRNKATQAILKKKPFGLIFRPLEVSFLVNYKDNDGVTQLSYIRNEVRFRCDWKRRLFATNYTITSEMVATDSRLAEANIPFRDSFRASQSLSDKVVDFADPDFWGAYNIIEPTESLESAVNKLKKEQD